MNLDLNLWYETWLEPLDMDSWLEPLDMNLVLVHLIFDLTLDPQFETTSHHLYTWYYLFWSSHNHSIDAPVLCTLVWLERCTTPSLLDYRLMLWLWLVYRGVWMHPRFVLTWYLLGLRPSWLWFGPHYIFNWWLGLRALQPLTSWELITPTWATWLGYFFYLDTCLAWGLNTENLETC